MQGYIKSHVGRRHGLGGALSVGTPAQTMAVACKTTCLAAFDGLTGLSLLGLTTLTQRQTARLYKPDHLLCLHFAGVILEQDFDL